MSVPNEVVLDEHKHGGTHGSGLERCITCELKKIKATTSEERESDFLCDICKSTKVCASEQGCTLTEVNGPKCE